MTFQIGSWVKWKEVCPVRLGYAPGSIGKVVGVKGFVAESDEIDVEFGDGEVVHGATGKWFEPVPPPAGYGDMTEIHADE